MNDIQHLIRPPPVEDDEDKLLLESLEKRFKQIESQVPPVTSQFEEEPRQNLLSELQQAMKTYIEEEPI